MLAQKGCWSSSHRSSCLLRCDRTSRLQKYLLWSGLVLRLYAQGDCQWLAKKHLQITSSKAHTSRPWTHEAAIWKRRNDQKAWISMNSTARNQTILRLCPSASDVCFHHQRPPVGSRHLLVILHSRKRSPAAPHVVELLQLLAGLRWVQLAQKQHCHGLALPLRDFITKVPPHCFNVFWQCFSSFEGSYEKGIETVQK